MKEPTNKHQSTNDRNGHNQKNQKPGADHKAEVHSDKSSSYDRNNPNQRNYRDDETKNAKDKDRR